MAKGNKMLDTLKPRVPTTGLTARSRAPSSRTEVPAKRLLSAFTPTDPLVATREAVKRANITRATPKPSIAAVPQMGERRRYVGMVRSRRAAPRQERTQFVGGRPGAVRMSYTPTTYAFNPQALPSGPEQASIAGALPPAFSDAERFRQGYQPIGSYAKGGDVDTVPAWLQPGEFVIDKAHTQKIKMARGGELERVVDNIVEDIKLGRRPGDRPVEGRTDFSEGGTVTEDMQPGYFLGGRVNLEDYKTKNRSQEEDERGFGQRPVRPGLAAPEYSADYKARAKANADRPHPRHYDDYDMYLIADEQWRAKNKYQQQQAEQQKREQAAEAAARQRQSQIFQSLRESSGRRADVTRRQGAELQRKAGEIARQQQQQATAQAARQAMSRASVQPVEASLSTASQAQLRSSLQGAIIKAQAELAAQQSNVQAELQSITDEMSILSQELQQETGRENREYMLQRQREADARRQFLAQEQTMLQLKIQKAQEPGFWEAMAPGLIQGGFTLLGAGIGFMAGGPPGAAAGAGIASGLGSGVGRAYEASTSLNSPFNMAPKFSDPAKYGYGGHYKQ